MAGDWLKMESSTPEKEEVLAITARMGWDDPDLTVGKLFRLWRWFDQQTVDGNAVRVTSALLDRVVGVSGFCAAVQEVGWIVIDAGGVSLPKFDRHNGASAKSRALTAKRVAKHKGNGNAEGNAPTVSAALPREEKRREEVKKAPTELPASSLRAKQPATPPPDFDGQNAQVLNGKHVVALSPTWDLPDEWGVDAEALGWRRSEVLLEAEKFRQYWTKGKGQGTRRAVKGWRQTWSNWLGKAADRKQR